MAYNTWYKQQKISDVLPNDTWCFQCFGWRINLARFRVNRLPTLRDGEQAKQAGELMRRALFEQWLIDHP